MKFCLRELNTLFEQRWCAGVGCKIILLTGLPDDGKEFAKIVRELLESIKNLVFNCLGELLNNYQILLKRFFKFRWNIDLGFFGGRGDMINIYGYSWIAMESCISNEKETITVINDTLNYSIRQQKFDYYGITISPPHQNELV